MDRFNYPDIAVTVGDVAVIIITIFVVALFIYKITTVNDEQKN